MVYELNLKKAFIKKKNRMERTGNEGHEVAEARQLGVSAEDEDQTEMGRKPTKQLRDYPKEEVVSECEVVCVILKVVPFPPQGGAFLNWFLPSDL